MTEPDEAHRAWDECATARFEDEMNGNPLDLPQGMPNIVDFKDGYRAGAAASEARIKALEEALRAANLRTRLGNHSNWSRALLKEGDQ